jgi:hypothetical protein
VFILQFDLCLHEFDPRTSHRVSFACDHRSDFNKHEALAAVKEMNRCSAPGPNGFGPGFYKVAWQTVLPYIMDFLHAFHCEGVQLESINRSHMVLIPKKPGANTVSTFRPICLQNCCVKILSKILTSRLQSQISRLVDLDQTGFIKGRSIS